MKKTNKNKSQLKNESLIIEKFQVEELEKRYELGWINVGVDVNKDTGVSVGVKLGKE